MRSIGVHLRVLGTIQSVADYALELKLTTFQCFLFHQLTRKYIQPTSADLKEFSDLARRFDTLYVHGSYFINLARTIRNDRHYLLQRELELAKRLQFTHIVLHPGSVPPETEVIQGIDAIVRVLNRLFKQDLGLTVLLENTAHGKRTIGGDLNDFYLIRSKLDKPELLQFCVDTAHAYCYGYDITTPQGRTEFFACVDATMGLENVSLIHLNDTKKGLGSRLDYHEVLGKGMLGFDVLKEFAMDRTIVDKPLILEMPTVTKDEEIAILDTIRSWHM